jgi:Chlorophyllase enzyme
MSTRHSSTGTSSLETLSKSPSKMLVDRQKTHFFKESVSSDIKKPYDGIFTELPCKPETSFSPEPSYPKTNHYTTTIASNGDATDIYYPIVDATTHPSEFPIALLLQGAQVDKADYSNFASQVAGYGFIVVVPNHQRTLTAPTGQSFTGLFPEPQQVNDVLEQMVIEDHNPDSPIAEIVDTDKLGLLGHSFGGSVGLGASQTDICIPGICSEDYTPPPELMAGIFYGTNFKDPVTNVFPTINNKDVVTGLIVGDRDGVIQPFSTQKTYDQILNSPKTLITVEGANHYGITNQDNLVREPSRSTLDQSIGIETISRWSALFLQAHLQGSQGALDYLYNTGDALDPNVSVINQSPANSVLASL